MALDQVVKPWWSVVQGSESTTSEHWGGDREREGERGREKNERERSEREKRREERQAKEPLVLGSGPVSKG